MKTTRFRIASAALSHRGRRSNNEDDFHTAPQLGLYAVSDGMGGYEGGEIASSVVVETLAEFFARNDEDGDITWPFALDRAMSFDENLVSVALRLAHRRVVRARVGRLANMGATAAALVLRGETAIIAHVGDSRVYRLRDGALEQMTRDHSLYAELLAQGAELPPPEQFPMSNVITRAIGVTDSAEPEVRSVSLRDGDRFLLCSDGLVERLRDEALAELLAASEQPEHAARDLVSAACEAGARDNITAVVVYVSSSDDEAEGPSKP